VLATVNAEDRRTAIKQIQLQWLITSDRAMQYNIPITRINSSGDIWRNTYCRRTQIAVQATILQAGQMTKCGLRLHPPELGDLMITIQKIVLGCYQLTLLLLPVPVMI